MSGLALSAEGLLAPLDGLRRQVLAVVARRARPLLRERELRVAVSLHALVAMALLTTLVLPLWVLALTPIVYGVPHLLADVRYLVVRPGLHRRRALWILAGPLLLLTAAGMGAGPGFLAVAAACLAARGALTTRLVLAAAAALLAGVGWRLGYVADLAMAHLHNLIAVLLFWAWRPRSGRQHLWALGLFLLCTLLILFTPLEQMTARLGGFAWIPAGLDLEYQRAWLSGGIGAPLGIRLVLCFAFAQSVHYGIWTRLIPEEDRRQPTPRSFAASWRALRSDFGRWPLLVAVLLTCGIAAWAIVDLTEARIGYFRLAQFHGYLELAAAAFLWLERRA